MDGRKKNTAPVVSRRGTDNRARDALKSTSILPQTPRKCKTQFSQTDLTTELADLRRRYNAAVVAERWQDAKQLQRAYQEAERRRRAELLRQAEVVTRG